MDKNFLHNKQISSNHWNNNIQKKFVTSTVTEKKHIRNPKQFNYDNIHQNHDFVQSEMYPQQVEQAHPKKPYRMNSVTKPSPSLTFKPTSIQFCDPKPKISASGLRRVAKEEEADSEDLLVWELRKKVEELEKKLKHRDAEIGRIKEQNRRLLEEKNKIERKYQQMEQRDMENERRRREIEEKEDQPGEGDEEQPEEVAAAPNTRDLEQHLLSLIMNNNIHELMMQNRYEEQKEQEMIELAIQESLKENPNVDMMGYEELQELGERIGTVIK